MKPTNMDPIFIDKTEAQLEFSRNTYADMCQNYTISGKGKCYVMMSLNRSLLIFPEKEGHIKEVHHNKIKQFHGKGQLGIADLEGVSFYLNEVLISIRYYYEDQFARFI